MGLFRENSVSCAMIICFASVFFAFSAAVLAFDEGARNVTTLQAGKLGAAPSIDGKITEDEWAGAAQVNMFHLLNSQSIYPLYPVARVGFDEDNLYIAVKVPIPTGAGLKAPKRDRDSDLWADDAVEIFLDPRHTHKEDYQFTVNAAGSMQDSLNSDNSWDGEWKCATSQSEKNWQVEIQIPFATLGVSKITTRRIMGFNIALDRTQPISANYTWSLLMNGGFHQVQNYGHLIIDPVGSGTSGMISGDGHGLSLMLNTFPADPDTEVSFGIYHNDMLVKEVKDRAAHDKKLTVELPDKEANYAYRAEISKAGKQIFYSSGELNASTFEPLRMTLRKFFIQGKLSADLEVGDAVSQNGPYIYTVSILDASGNEVDSDTISNTNARKLSFDFDISKRPLEQHTVKAVMRNASGYEIASKSISYTRPPIPEWYGSTAGISDEVLPPWTPMKTTQSSNAIKVSPWGRTYTFKGLPFPSSIRTKNADILSGPVAFNLVVDGRPVALKGSLKVNSQSDARTVLTGTASGGSLDVSSKVTIDYDGSADVDLRISALKRVTIDKFSIEAPVKSKHALYRYFFPGSWGSSENARALPESGWQSDYVPYIWTGDNDRGFAIHSISDQNWTSSDKIKSVEIMPQGKSTMVMRFNIVAKPVVVDAGDALDYAFGFQATPVKDPDKDVWDYRICRSATYNLPYTYTGKQTSLSYPKGLGLDPKQGSIEMWVKVNFDPNQTLVDEATRGDLNRDFIYIKSPSQILGFYWNVDVRGMRLYLKDGSSYPLMLDKQTFWKEGELHHLAITWGDEVKVYIDGVQTGSKKWDGLLKDPSSEISVDFSGNNPGFCIDELRISDIAREITVPDAPYTVDEHTILLEHYDKLNKIGENKFESVPERGTPGEIVGMGELTDGKFDKALQTMAQRMPTLDYLKMLGYRTLVFHEHWTEIQNYTETIHNQEKLKNLVKICHDHGFKILLYFGYEIADIAPEWDDYHNEMLAMPIRGGYTREPAQIDRIVCYNSAWQDFLADGVDKMMKKYDIDGVYLDGTSYPQPCSNTSHGCGYVRPDGSIGQTYSFRGARDMMRRLYTVVKSNKPDGQVNLHNSLVMTMPSNSWATSTWDGEQFGFIQSKVDMEQLFPLDAFRTEFMGTQWGVPSEILCYGIPFTFHQAFSFSLLHDVLVRGEGAGIEEEARIWKVMDEFGRKEAEFIPYFKNEHLAKVSGEHNYVSLYVRPGKGVMCVVSNLGPDTREVTVNLNLAKMKLPKNVTAIDAFAKENIELENGSFTVKLNTFDYTMIWIK